MVVPGPFSNPGPSWPLLLVVPGVSKVVTVDVKGNWQRWLKVRDLTKGVTYFFRVQARTIAYGPELQANVTAGPAEGKWRPAWAPQPIQCKPLTPGLVQSKGLPSLPAKQLWPAQSGHKLRNLPAVWVSPNT